MGILIQHRNTLIAAVLLLHGRRVLRKFQRILDDINHQSKIFQIPLSNTTDVISDGHDAQLDQVKKK